MPAPARWVFSIAPSARFGDVEYDLDPAAQPGCGLVLAVPDGPDDRQDVVGGDRINRLGADHWIGVAGERAAPLLLMLRVLPGRRHCLDVLLGHLHECRHRWRGPTCPPCVDRITPGAQKLPGFVGLTPGIRQRQPSEAAEAKLARLPRPRHLVDERPSCRVGAADLQKHRASRGVAGGGTLSNERGCLNHRRDYSHVASLSLSAPGRSVIETEPVPKPEPKPRRLAVHGQRQQRRTSNLDIPVAWSITPRGREANHGGGGGRALLRTACNASAPRLARSPATAVASRWISHQGTRLEGRLLTGVGRNQPIRFRAGERKSCHFVRQTFRQLPTQRGRQTVNRAIPRSDAQGHPIAEISRSCRLQPDVRNTSRRPTRCWGRVRLKLSERGPSALADEHACTRTCKQSRPPRRFGSACHLSTRNVPFAARSSIFYLPEPQGHATDRPRPPRRSTGLRATTGVAVFLRSSYIALRLSCLAVNTQPDLTLTAPRVSDGPVKGGNGAFSDPSQWIDVTDPDNTGTLAPASSDDADFPSGGDVSGSGDVAALTVESSVEFSANVSAGSITNSGQVTISGGTLSTTGELNNTGGITLGSGALISDFVSDTGNIGVGSGGSLSTTANLYVGSGGDGTLSVTNGASVDVGTFTEIGGAGGYGTVTIDGSQWTSGPAVPPGTSTQTGNVDVGDDGTGGLTVTNGSTVTVNGGIYVGSADPGETGSGTLTIDGGSTVYANGDFGVRLAQDPGSSGTLILTGAGTELFAGSASVTDSDEFSIGSASGSGTAVVADGALAVTEDFAIGSGVEGHPNGGTGVGTIKSGATVESGSGQVGAFGGTGTLTVDDALWAITGELDIGAEGGQTQIANGTLIVQNRGTVTDATGSIATFAASGTEQGTTGTVTITGPASRWDNTGDLDVGNGGTGALTIQDGGSVSVGGLLDIGTQSGAVGTVTVADSASSIALAGDLTVGDAGTGTLALANGTSTAITGDTDIGAQQGGDGTVDLNPGAFLGGGGDLTVGYGGIGDLELSNASTATFGGDLGEAAEGGSSGTITVDNSIFDVTGSATVGDGGSGTLSAIDGSTFDVGAVAQIGNSTGGNGGLLLDASQMAIGPAVPSDTSTQAGNLGIGNDSTGVATVTDGATLTVNGGIYVGSADPGDTASGTLTIDGGSTVYANGDFGVRLGQDPGSSGTLVVTGAGSALFAGSPSVTGVDEFGVASGAGAATAVIADQALVQTEEFFFGSVVEPYTDGGTGSATMESAATVESGDGGVGAFGGSGSITVDDALWAITGELDVGQSGGATQVGQGLLIVQDGGTVTDATGTVATYQPGSGQQTETGTVVVTGAASLWDTSGDLYVGDAAAGTLSISDGGTVVVGGNLDIGTQTSAVGTVMLSGSTSTLSVTGPVIVGDDGNGVLDLSQGASLTADSLMIGSTGGGGGTLAVDGATLTVDGNANVDTGTLDVENGATLTVTGSLTGGGIAGSSATISIGDAQVTADVGGNLLVGEGGTLDLEVGGGITDQR